MSAVPRFEPASSATTHRLYEQYGKQIYAYCYQRLRSREEAEDAVQTTFLNAFRALQRGTVTEFQQAWLFKIAQNVCLERVQASGKRAQLESPSDLQVLQETAPAHLAPDSEQLIGVEDALQRIPANQRKAILLREWQGLSYREIGEELGLSQPAVEMLIFRARRSLATALEQPGQVQEKKQRRLARGGALNLGSLVTAVKTLLTGGAGVKAVAVAVSAGAAVVSIGAPASRTSVPRHHGYSLVPAAATLRVTRAKVAAVDAVEAPSRTVAVQAPVRKPRPAARRHVERAKRHVVRAARPVPQATHVVPARPVAPPPAPPAAPVAAAPAPAPAASATVAPSSAPAASEPKHRPTGGRGGGTPPAKPPVSPEPPAGSGSGPGTGDEGGSGGQGGGGHEPGDGGSGQGQGGDSGQGGDGGHGQGDGNGGGHDNGGGDTGDGNGQGNGGGNGGGQGDGGGHGQGGDNGGGGNGDGGDGNGHGHGGGGDGGGDGHGHGGGGDGGGHGHGHELGFPAWSRSSSPSATPAALPTPASRRSRTRASTGSSWSATS